jgi:anti-sigma B factor antagonist
VVAPRTQLSVRETAVDGSSVVLSAVGELDIGTSEQLRAAAARYVMPGARVTLDLSGVTFCDSTGLAALVGIYKRLVAVGGTLLLRDPVPRVRNLLTVTGLNRVLTIEEAVDG